MTALNKIENIDTKEYRSWLIYSLVKNCVACHPVLKKHLEMIEEIDSDTSDTSPKQKTVKRKRRVAYEDIP